MILIDQAKNVALDAIGGDVDNVSLHTSYSATGANEVSGGSYARQSVTWNAAATGNLNSSNQPAPDVPGGTTVQYVGYWDATGPTFYGMVPLAAASSGTAYMDATNNNIVSHNHGLSNDDRVAFFGPNIAGELTEGQLYYVVSSATDTFAVATSSGGSAITFASDGNGQWSDGTPETFSNDGTLTLTDLDISLNLLT